MKHEPIQHAESDAVVEEDNGTKWVLTKVPVVTETDLIALTGCTRWEARKALEDLLPVLDRGRGGKFYCAWTAFPAIVQTMKGRP